MKTKTRTKQKILKVFAMCILFLGNSHLMAQMNDLPTQTVCVGETQPYTLVDPAGIPPAATATYEWSVTGGGTFNSSNIGHTVDIEWTTIGTYTVTVVATDDITGCEGTPIDVVVTVENLASSPLALNPAAICFGDLNPQMTASTGGGTGNSVFNWYADNGGSPGSLLVANSTTYQELIQYPDPGVGLVQSYYYWVTEESANECEGSATMVTVTVTGSPAVPSTGLFAYEACFNDPTNPTFTASGAGSIFNWYDNLGNPLATNAVTYTSTEVNPATYTYFVEEEVGSCTSPQTSFTFTIHSPPAVPSITPAQIIICEGDTPGDFAANTGGAAGTFTWSFNSTVIPGSTTCTPTQIAVGSYTYYLTETHPITTCVSVSSQATFTINELPLVPTFTVNAGSSSSICVGDINPIFTAVHGVGSSGTSNFEWYDIDPTSGAAPFSTSSTFNPTQTVVGAYTYWLIETNSTTGCKGQALLFTFEIIALPTAPTISVNPVQVCFNEVNPALSPIGSASGTNLTWYDVDPTTPGATPVLSNSATFTPPVSVVGNATTVTTFPYWVVDQPGSCVSPPLQVDLQINPLPTPGPIWHN